MGVFADAPPERGSVIWFSLFWESGLEGNLYLEGVLVFEVDSIGRSV